MSIINTANIPGTGTKFDEGKARYDLLPWDALDEVAKVYAIGARKYGDRNWEQGMPWGRVYAAGHRHQSSFWQGERYDQTDGQHHLAAAAFNILALLAYDLRGIGEDNRNLLPSKAARDFKDKLLAYASATQNIQSVIAGLSPYPADLPQPELPF